jgi:hypothetical protein
MPSDMKRAGSISEKSVWGFKRDYKSLREGRPPLFQKRHRMIRTHKHAVGTTNGTNLAEGGAGDSKLRRT